MSVVGHKGVNPLVTHLWLQDTEIVDLKNIYYFLYVSTLHYKLSVDADYLKDFLHP